MAANPQTVAACLAAERLLDAALERYGARDAGRVAPYTDHRRRAARTRRRGDVAVADRRRPWPWAGGILRGGRRGRLHPGPPGGGAADGAVGAGRRPAQRHRRPEPGTRRSADAPALADRRPGRLGGAEPVSGRRRRGHRRPRPAHRQRQRRGQTGRVLLGDPGDGPAGEGRRAAKPCRPARSGPRRRGPQPHAAHPGMERPGRRQAGHRGDQAGPGAEPPDRPRRPGPRWRSGSSTRSPPCRPPTAPPSPPACGARWPREGRELAAAFGSGGREAAVV